MTKPSRYEPKSKTEITRELLTVKEACEYAQLHPMTVYRLCQQGKLRHKKWGIP